MFNITCLIQSGMTDYLCYNDYKIYCLAGLEEKGIYCTHFHLCLIIIQKQKMATE